MQPLYSVIKKAVLFAGVFLGYIYGANAQYNGTLTLGTGTITDSHSPIYSYYYNSYNQMIYTASEIGTGHAGTICSIEFRVSSGTINTNVNVYLGHTAKTSFNNNTDWIPHVLLTQVVYNQYINFASGWVTLTFAVPFAYNGTNNLIVAVEQQNGSYSMVNFYNTTQPNNKTLYYYSDYNTFNYASPSSGTMMTNRANIRLNFANCSESIRVMSETPITNCNFLYVDQGGLSGNYNNNQNIIQTITSTNNEHLRISFQQFALSSGDYLSIYDGNNISAPLIGTYTGNTLPPTSTSSSNTLTFRFVSNATGVNAGWLAQINCLTCTPQPSNPGSPCNNASISPFCTEIVEGVEYNSGTGSNTNAVNFFDTTSVACLHTIDHPSAWFYLRINNPGNLLMEISQHRPNGSAMDVDFACWGPFNAATPNVFLEKLCCGFYTFHTAYHSSHHPTNGNHNGNTGGYPFGNLIDCSYDVSNTEWCYIPNAQVGEFYLILITNFGGSAGTVSFQQVNTNYTSGTSDCSLVSTAGNNGPYCVGDTIQLLCQTSELSMTYLWSGPNGFSSTLQNPIIPNATLLNNGTYTVMVSVGTDSTTAVTEVIVNEIPDVHITASALEMCSGGSLTLTASGAESYQWSIGSNSSNPILNISMVTFVELTYVQYAVTGISNGCSNVDTITICVINRPDTTRVSAEICFGETYQQHNFSQDTTGIYYQHYYTADHCDSIVELTLTVNPLPACDMSFLTNPYCPNEIITLTPTITTGTAPFNYQWIGTGIQSPTTLSTEIMNPILLCENSFWVYLTTTDSHGCAATDSVFIHYQDNTAPSFSSSIAQYDAIVGLNEYLVPNLTDEVLALAQDFCTTSSSLSIAQIPVASTACTDPTEVIVTVADPCGNSISMTIPLLFLPPLTVDSLNLTPISCFGLEEGTATVWISGGTPPYSYEWNTIPTQTTATASSLSAGSYSVTITDAHNFQTIAFANLIQPDSIVLIATPIHATCGIHNGAIITTVSGGTLPYSFLWNDGIADQNRSNLAKGIYHLLLTDANGCSDTIDILVDSLSVLRATLSNISQDSCGLSAGSLSVAVAGGRAPYSYQWSTGATNTSSISELAAGYYSVSVTDADNCLDIANTILYDYPMVIRADTILHDICGNHNGAIVLSVSNGNSNHYQVDWGGDISDYDALQANHLSEGSYSILVSDGICIVPFTFNINLISAPNADFIITTSPPYFAGNDLRFNDLSQGNMVSWRWNFGDHETSATQHPSHLYQDAGHYTIQLTVTTDYNCVDSTEQEIDVIDYTAIFIPNAFAPYSETNNVFKPIFHNPNPQDYSLEIYDRWGKLLFHSTDIDYGWDGTVNGKLIEYTSTYVYVISYKEVTNTLLHQRRGSVTLITN